jgi:sugar lactone lactonase YvrE
MTARLLLESNDVVGESIIWSPSDQCLYWVDIVGGRIHRLDPETGAHETWTTPELPTSIGLTKAGDFIVGLRRRIARWRPGGAFETFAVPEPDIGGNRLNEGVVAPDGSFWVGTMQDNIGPDLGPREMGAPAGTLYRVAPDGVVTRLTSELFGITNTMVWLDDGRFVTADTLANELYIYEYDPAGVRLRDRRVLDRIERGLPDGSTRDNAGTIYNARVAGGAAIAKINPANGAVAFVDLPCASPTSCTFGGRDLRTLYVTSSRFGMSAEALEGNRFDGSLYAVESEGQGIEASRFG